MQGPLELNLATRPFRNNTLVWAAHVLAVVLVAGTSVGNVRAYLEARRGHETLRQQVASVEKRLAELERREQSARESVSQHDLKDLALRTKKANDVIRRKALSWTRLFNALEEVLPYDVRMISIRPVFVAERGISRDTEQGEIPEGAIPVQIQGAARGGTERFVEFVRALLQDDRFSHVDLERESHQQGELFFDMRFLYYPGEESEERRPAAEASQALEPAAQLEPGGGDR